MILRTKSNSKKGPVKKQVLLKPHIWRRGAGTLVLGVFFMIIVFLFILMFMEIYQQRENYIETKAATDTIADGTALYAQENYSASYSDVLNRANTIKKVVKDEVGIDVGDIDISEDDFTDESTVTASVDPTFNYITNSFGTTYDIATTSGTQFTNYAAFLDYASVDEAQADVASKVYSVLKALGWTNNEIAGALGNMQTECSFDFTSVETIFTEPFEWGPRKQAADAADYMMSSVHPGYQFPNVKRCGIGLIQWTDTWSGATNNTQLRNYAAANHAVWYSLELQLQYIIDPDGDSARSRMIRYRGNYSRYSGEDVESTTMWWSHYIEGCIYDKQKRVNSAYGWAAKLNSGQVPYNESYANKVLSAAGLKVVEQE